MPVTNHMRRPTQRCMVDSLSNENWVIYGRAKIVNSAAFNVKSMHSGKRAKAISHGPPGLVNGIMGEVSFDFFVVHCSPLGVGLGRIAGVQAGGLM